MSATLPDRRPDPTSLALLPRRRLDQVRLDSGADLLHLDQLDQKLWVALPPGEGAEFDARTLALLDADADAISALPT